MTRRLLSSICLLLCVGQGAPAEQLLFRDDFDGSISDAWFTVNQVGQRSVVNGTYQWTPTSNALMNSLLNGDFPANISLRTRVRLLDAPEGDWVFIGVVGRHTMGMSNDYYGGIASDNRVGIGVSNGPVLNTAFIDLDVVTQDVELRFDLMEDELTMTAWVAGTYPPQEPQVRVTDDRVVEGGVAMLSYNPRNATNLPTLAFDYFEVVGLNIKRGDFNYDGTLDVDDIDALTMAARTAPTDRVFDVNDDGQVDLEDRRIWVEQLRQTWFGDSNLDGEFNSQDFVVVLQGGQYEDDLPKNATWATGDWNGDAEFDSGDLVLALQMGGYELGPRATAAAIPEPSSCLLLALAILGMPFLGTTRRKT